MAKKKNITPELKDILVIGNFSDGKVRQILTTKGEKDCILGLLVQTSVDGKVKILDKPIEGLTFIVNNG
jgi:hypothetical protein